MIIMDNGKILTRWIVEKLGFDKLEVITSDMIDGYTSIGNGAFAYHNTLTSISIPNSVTSIGNEAFRECISLTTVSIGNSVTSIGEFAFYDCSSLTSITIPDSVTSIGGYAFCRCSSLTSISIPDTVTIIGERAFANCTSLPIEDNMRYADTYLVEAVDKSLSTYTIKTGTKWIGDNAFSGCSTITSITIPNSVTSIGSDAFYKCTSLTSVNIPNSVTSISWNVFYGCHKLNSILIGDKTYEIQEVANSKCKAYKAFNADLTCREFQYEEGKTYEIEDAPILCEQGFHACLNLKDVFGYYYGELGKDIVVHEVELEDVSFEMHNEDSKVVAKKITIGKRIL